MGSIGAVELTGIWNGLVVPWAPDYSGEDKFNEGQNRLARNAMQNWEYRRTPMVIRGPPGTGKLGWGGADAWNHAPRVRTRRVGGNTEFDLGQGTQARIGIRTHKDLLSRLVWKTRGTNQLSPEAGPRQRLTEILGDLAAVCGMKRSKSMQNG